jgi:predicted nucleic acid-binding Zn ribbon protein
MVLINEEQKIANKNRRVATILMAIIALLIIIAVVVAILK